jgi:hypothetical protein
MKRTAVLINLTEIYRHFLCANASIGDRTTVSSSGSVGPVAALLRALF